jgi:hypothetical protein
MPEMTLTTKSVRIAKDEAKWLSAAATEDGVTQNDLVRLALHRLRKELGRPAGSAPNRPRHRVTLTTSMRREPDLRTHYMRHRPEPRR